MDYLQPKTGESSENTEKQFLLSLLPYMSEMNVWQEKNIQKRALGVIGSFFDEEEQQSVSGSLLSFPST